MINTTASEFSSSSLNGSRKESLIRFHINNFFKNEVNVCNQAKAVAEALRNYKEQLEDSYKKAAVNFPQDLKAKYHKIEMLIFLYEYLGANCFGLSSEQEQLSDEAKLDLILATVKSKLFLDRIVLLNDAARLYEALCDTIIPWAKRNTTVDVNARTALQNYLSAPMQRVLRMNLTFNEIREQYTKQECNIPASLESLVLKFNELAKQANFSQTVQDASQRRNNFNYALASTLHENINQEGKQDKFRRIRLNDPKKAVAEYSQRLGIDLDNEAQTSNNFLKLFEGRYQAKSKLLSVETVIQTLKDNYPTALEQLQAIEKAFGEIRRQTSNNQPTLTYFFRKNFPYNNLQLADIKVLKQSYLQIVVETPQQFNEEFDKYLEKQYQKGAKAEDIGGVLAFNRTTCRWFIQDQTKSMKQLEDLKAGIGRVRLQK